MHQIRGRLCISIRSCCGPSPSVFTCPQSVCQYSWAWPPLPTWRSSCHRHHMLLLYKQTSQHTVVCQKLGSPTAVLVLRPCLVHFHLQLCPCSIILPKLLHLLSHILLPFLGQEKKKKKKSPYHLQSEVRVLLCRSWITDSLQLRAQTQNRAIYHISILTNYRRSNLSAITEPNEVIKHNTVKLFLSCQPIYSTWPRLPASKKKRSHSGTQSQRDLVKPSMGLN